MNIPKATELLFAVQAIKELTVSAKTLLADTTPMPTGTETVAQATKRAIADLELPFLQLLNAVTLMRPQDAPPPISATGTQTASESSPAPAADAINHPKPAKNDGPEQNLRPATDTRHLSSPRKMAGF